MGSRLKTVIALSKIQKQLLLGVFLAWYGRLCGSALQNPSHKWVVQAPSLPDFRDMDVDVGAGFATLTLFTLFLAPPVGWPHIIVTLFIWPELFSYGFYILLSAPENYWSYASSRVSARIRGFSRRGGASCFLRDPRIRHFRMATGLSRAESPLVSTVGLGMTLHPDLRLLSGTKANFG